MSVEKPEIVGDLLNPTVESIAADETVGVARRRMESEAIRSLIVVDQHRPVGIVQWRAVSSAPANELISSVMQADVPTVTSNTNLESVRELLVGSHVDLDNLPVVDEAGHLVGSVQRRFFTHGESHAATDAVAPPVHTAADSAAGDDATGPTYSLHQGMKVVGVSGKGLGDVDEILLTDDDKISSFTVKYGFLGRNAKRLPADVIGGVQNDEVHVSLDQQEFKMLADIDDIVD